MVDVPAGFLPITSNNPFARALGPLYERGQKGGFVRAFRVEEIHCNALNIVHGGMLMTFADVVLAQAVVQKFDCPAMTVRMTIDFISAGKLGDWIEGTAHILNVANKMAQVDGMITCHGQTIVKASGLFKIVRLN